MGLVIDGHDVKGLALGGNSFYALQKNDDGSITLNDKKYFSKLPTPTFKSFEVSTSNSYYIGLAPNGNGRYLHAIIDEEYRDLMLTSYLQVMLSIGWNNHTYFTDYFTFKNNPNNPNVNGIMYYYFGTPSASISYNKNTGELDIYSSAFSSDDALVEMYVNYVQL